jgi:hypothetical protein
MRDSTTVTRWRDGWSFFGVGAHPGGGDGGDSAQKQWRTGTDRLKNC